MSNDKPTTILRPGEQDEAIGYEEDAQQLGLLDVPTEYDKAWVGMPEFDLRDLSPRYSLLVHFKSRDDRRRFAEVIGQTVTELTQSIWYPQAVIGRLADRCYRSVTPREPRYPILCDFEESCRVTSNK